MDCKLQQFQTNSLKRSFILLCDFGTTLWDLTHKHQPKPAVKLPGWGGRWRGQVRGDLQHQSTKSIHDLTWTQSPWLWTRISSNCSDLWLGTLLLSAMLYGRGRNVLTLCGGSDCSSSDSGVSAAGDTSLSSCPVLVLLALDRKRELEGRGLVAIKEV